MGRRMVETDRWNKPWYRKLGPHGRDIWNWLNDNVELSGVWEIDLERFSFEVGFDVTMEQIEKVFGDRIRKLPDNKLWIPAIANFQNPALSDKCNAHIKIIARMKQLGIWDEYLELFPDGYIAFNPSPTLPGTLGEPNAKGPGSSSGKGRSRKEGCGEKTVTWEFEARRLLAALRKYGTGSKDQKALKESLGPLFKIACKAPGGIGAIRAMPSNDFTVRNLASTLAAASETMGSAS